MHYLTIATALESIDFIYVLGELGEDERALADLDNDPEQEDAFEDDEGISQEELDAMADPDDLEAMGMLM